jgi:hypothetical protein
LLHFEHIVPKLFSTLLTTRNSRFLFAGVFVLVLLAEWGSHGVIFSQRDQGGETAMSTSERGHEDPCGTMILCSDGRRNDQVPSISHDASQHNAYFDNRSNTGRNFVIVADPLRHSSFVFGLSRPPDPAFHPPEIS